MELVYISQLKPVAGWDLPSSRNITHINDVSALKADALKSFIFVIGGADEAFAEQTAFALRGLPAVALSPIFIMTPFDSQVLDRLTDGVVSLPEEALQRGQWIFEALNSFPKVKDALNQDERLLRFLISRPEHRLSPIESWQGPSVYSYPLLNALSDVKDVKNGVHEWLDSLIRRQLIQREGLVDRVRECTECHSGRLHYQECCPSCDSQDIANRYVHCFSCGRVSAQDEIIGRGHIACPNCGSSLRPDLVMLESSNESYLCNQCQSNFNDPAARYRCIDCQAHISVAKVIVRSIYRYNISEQGKKKITLGRLDDVYASIDYLSNYVDNREFSHSLGWLINIKRRYPEHEFALLGLHIGNLDEVIAQHGRAKITSSLNSWAEKVRQVIRETDLATRTTENLLWILLPETDAMGCKALADRLLLASREVTEGGEALFDIFLVAYDSQTNSNYNETADDVLERLSHELELLSGVRHGSVT